MDNGSASQVKNNYQVYATADRNVMLSFVPKEARRILDVGCSIGNFGNLLKSERGAEVWGIETDPEAAKIAETVLDRVICGSFGSSADLPVGHFDCVVFNDVLEHMIDPYSVLEYTKSILAPGGTIVASIPNVRYFPNIWIVLMHKNWEYTDAGILDRTHLRFFTEKSIIRLFEDRGLKISRLEGINPLDIYDRYAIWKFRLLNAISFKAISDMRWMQFAVVAKLDELEASR